MQQKSICLESLQNDCKVDFAFFDLFKSIRELYENDKLTPEEISNLELARKNLRLIIAKHLKGSSQLA
ncbi:hypothetical protein [Legionella maceachernii]|uniref:Uncharacterized protein n=1 Tax=Legionella maceachernii TaxID=466 RepID=A0A0W0VYI6_9GAMM|nr:hypothetical protein [Legionella maceachernii]KTD25160.1 hypothetical protein Lmac_2138 [Legionella maceachernii]SKA27200.1 hypothetical protein SAMN02745128_02949 [Legionella maceachernii]SUP04589.1 Uncharacterised protein [Legionella maceachernii]